MVRTVTTVALLALIPFCAVTAFDSFDLTVTIVNQDGLSVGGTIVAIAAKSRLIHRGTLVRKFVTSRKYAANGSVVTRW